MKVQLIGDQIWVEGWHVADMRPELDGTARGMAEAALIPSPPLTVQYVGKRGSSPTTRRGG